MRGVSEHIKRKLSSDGIKPKVKNLIAGRLFNCAHGQWTSTFNWLSEWMCFETDAEINWVLAGKLFDTVNELFAVVEISGAQIISA